MYRSTDGKLSSAKQTQFSNEFICDLRFRKKTFIF